MKKGTLFVSLILLFCSFLLIGCIDLLERLKAPVTNLPQVENRTVTFSWSAVNQATGYLLSIDKTASELGSRAEGFPVEKVISTTSTQWKASEPGEYTWKVRAQNADAFSKWVSGDNFTVSTLYNVPVVTITSPNEGEIVETLTPAIMWTAQPGEIIQAFSRDIAVDSCQVIISEDSVPIYTGEGVQGVGNNWSYQVPADVLSYGDTYTIQVTASQSGATALGEDELSFQTHSGITLELSENSLYNCGVIVATITAHDPDMDKVALFARLQTQQDYIQLAPPSGWRDLNNDRQAVFTIETNDLGPGIWWINAQSSGSSSKSTEKSLEIKEVTLIPELTLNLCGDVVKTADYVYMDQADLPATAAYTLNIQMDEELTGVISEFFYVFEFAGSDTLVTSSATYNRDTWQATDIVVTMATECTKLATLTVYGTSVCKEHPTYHVFTPATLNFTLDAALPEISFHPHQFGLERETLTIPVHLADTKSLCQATLSFFVEKENAQGTQMPGWEPITLLWGQEAVHIGMGSNAVDGTVTYSAPIVFGQTTSVDATVLLALGELDGATITASVTAIDCCNGGCVNTCSQSEQRESSSEAISLFFDNTFYHSHSINISFLDSEDFQTLNNSWLLTLNQDTGQASFAFSDAYIDGFDNLQATLTGVVDAVTLHSTGTMITDYVAECTGYPIKNMIHILMQLTAIHGTETSVNIEITGTDEHANTKSLTQNILVDTRAPQLDSADGHMGQKAGNSSDDYVEFAFEAVDRGQVPAFEGATVTIDGNSNKQQWYAYLGSVYDYEDQRGIVRLNEDNQFRVNFDESSYGLKDGGTVLLEINATDKYMNTDYTAVTGNVQNP